MTAPGRYKDDLAKRYGTPSSRMTAEQKEKMYQGFQRVRAGGGTGG